MLRDDAGIFALLREEHAHIHALLDNLVSASEADRRDTFPELFRLLVSHGRAEESVVYARAGVEFGADHQTLEDALDELTHLDQGSPAWEKMLVALRTAVAEHVQREEVELFAALQALLSEEECDALARQYQATREAEVRRLEDHPTHSWRSPDVAAAPWLL